ncbi:hypothetical protein PRECH8_00320 [Insulibacter thermoxylanivorax]|uniref:Uncharacterized protein n=1 Tax=Insulibacter thermoxylanivorax TaxID=2749268 RepID=A0A916QDW7_9BACL|nr:hypothetical protein [Insulibacter thermoxylanivorax]GFR36736.1 hypothetical protein PRECH8_00320 [Insulibacter thermoxylanivorax]
MLEKIKADSQAAYQKPNGSETELKYQQLLEQYNASNLLDEINMYTDIKPMVLTKEWYRIVHSSPSQNEMKAGARSLKRKYFNHVG